MPRGTTHVANATLHTIWVFCDCDRKAAIEATSRDEFTKNGSTEVVKVTNNTYKTNALFFSSDRNTRNEQRTNEKWSSSSKHEEHQKYQLLHIAESRGFTKIISQCALPFATTGDPVFISIMIETEGGARMDVVATAFPCEFNRNIILRYDGQIFLQGLGYHNLFLTAYGEDIEYALLARIQELKNVPANRSRNAIEKPTFGIQGNNGKFVSGENGCCPMKCNRDRVGAHEQFSMRKLPNGKVVLMSMGLYLSSENNQGPMTCNRESYDLWEMFDFISHPDGLFSLRGNNGKYVSSENGQKPMACRADHIKGWELFSAF